MNDDYKVSKEAFVSGMTGSSIGHVNMVFLVGLVSVCGTTYGLILTLVRRR